MKRKKIRILNIITRLELGGPPIILLDIIQRLNRDRFESSIATGITPDSKYDMCDFARQRHIEVFTFRSLVRDIHPLKDILALISLFLFIRRGNYDIIHCHTSKAGFIGRLAAKLAGANVILYSPHGDVFNGYFNSLVTSIFIILERFVAPFTDNIITLSNKGSERFLEHGIGTRQQLKHIYNGIDIINYRRTNTTRAEKRSELGLSRDDFVCATVGRLVPVKGHRYLIEAIRKVVNEIPSAKFLFVGDGELMPELQRQSESLDLCRNILFLGARSDVVELLNCADIFLLPSLNEGFGIVLIEAMAMKRPIIATDVGGIPEIVIDEKTGILLPPKDPEAFASAIIRLYNNPETVLEMGEAGHKRAENLFDIKATVTEFETLYSDLIKRKGFAG